MPMPRGLAAVASQADAPSPVNRVLRRHILGLHREGLVPVVIARQAGCRRGTVMTVLGEAGLTPNRFVSEVPAPVAPAPPPAPKPEEGWEKTEQAIARDDRSACRAHLADLVRETRSQWANGTTDALRAAARGRAYRAVHGGDEVLA